MMLFQRIGLGIVFVLLLAYGVAFYNGMQETQNAQRVDDVQVVLQKGVAEGMAALQQSADEIDPDNIVNAVQSKLPQQTHLDNHLHLTLLRSSRTAQFTIASTGVVTLSNLENFTRYHIQAGRIARNVRWEWGL